jgi:replication-associated recombination protein RarA
VRLVIDVFQETDKEERERDPSIDLWFWKREHGNLAQEIKRSKLAEAKGAKTAKTGYTRHELDIEDSEERPEVEIPIHPMLATFDMKRHVRLRVHVGCMTEYLYDTTMSSRLILPDEVRALVEMLVTNKGVFRDIIAGKGGGAVVLCAGPAGCGKTLTAEVYAETMQRPLYSVQCSQLGLSPEDLENELMKVFQRSQRWNAILLLDEADVYIAARGNDIKQNAIVGVFLRVLEYYGGILFLTTNRSDLVDDAIASRCIARIDYTVPTPSDQHKIWRVLADTAEIPLAEAVIKAVVARFPHLSGRDVKNLLKLARMVSESRKQPIDLAMLEFVKRFKPTTDTAPDTATPLPGVNQPVLMDGSGSL